MTGHYNSIISSPYQHNQQNMKEDMSNSTVHSFIPLACAASDDFLLFSGASSIPLCYVLFPSTLPNQLFFHPLSPHLAIYFLVYLSILLFPNSYMRVGTLIVATIYLQLIQNRYMFQSFTVLHCSHQHCVQPVASDVEVVGYL